MLSSLKVVEAEVVEASQAVLVHYSHLSLYRSTSNHIMQLRKASRGRHYTAVVVHEKHLRGCISAIRREVQKLEAEARSRSRSTRKGTT